MNTFSRIKLLLQLQSALGKFQNAWKNLTNDKEIRMLTFEQILKSKVVWTNVITFAIAGYAAIQGSLPHSVTDIIATCGPLLTLIWKIFSTKQVPVDTTSSTGV